MLMRHTAQGGCGRPGAAREETRIRPMPAPAAGRLGALPCPAGLGRTTSCTSPSHWPSRLTSHEPAEALDRPGPTHPRPKGRYATERLTPPSLLLPKSANPAVAVSTRQPLPRSLGIGWIPNCAGALCFRCRLAGMYVNQ